MADQQNPKQDRTKPPTGADMLTLPKWARLAFSSRSVGRVLHVFTANWPGAPRGYFNAVVSAVEYAHGAASSGVLDSAVCEQLAYDTEHVAADGVKAAYAADIDDDSAFFARDAAELDSAASVATAASLAVSACNPDTAAFASATAFHSVQHARRQVVLQSMWFDYDLLVELAKFNNWNDDSPVDPDLCGPLWPFGKPEGWREEPSTLEPLPALQIDIAVPAGMTEAQRKEFVLRVSSFYGELSALHVQMGGHGLRFLDGRSVVHDPAESEAPTPCDPAVRRDEVACVGGGGVGGAL